jgi:hypothetical protein
MIKIILEPEKYIELETVNVLTVIDSKQGKTIAAYIEGLNRQILLWNGEEEYEQAGDWTDKDAVERATEMLSLSTIPWV